VTRRATRDQLAHATGCLEQLAYGTDSQTSPTFDDLATLLDLAAWLDSEIEAARRAAAYGSGIAEVHVLGSSSRGVEARLNDRLLKDLRKLRLSWTSRLSKFVADLQSDAAREANWPTRTQETG
jgi:hypothetical protein